MIYFYNLFGSRPVIPTAALDLLTTLLDLALVLLELYRRAGSKKREMKSGREENEQKEMRESDTFK